MNKYRIPFLLILGLGLSISPTFAQSENEDEEEEKDEEQEQEEVYDLSPFEVDVSEDDGYLAANSLAGTRFNTSLRDIPASVSAFTEAFLEDLAIQSADELVDWTLNQRLELGDSGVLTGYGQYQGDWTVQRVRVRGFSTTPAVDYFRRLYTSDGYNTGRYDESRGPNGILFGISSAGGVINATTLSASPHAAYGRIRFVAQSNDGLRGEFRYNKPIIQDKLGITVAAVKQAYNGWQYHVWDDHDAVHAGLTYKVNDNITFRAKGEEGSRSWANTVNSKPEANSIWVYQDWLNSPNTPARLAELGLDSLFAKPDNGNANSRERVIGIPNRISNGNNAERWFYVHNDQHLFNAGGTFNLRSNGYGQTGVESPDGWTSPFTGVANWPGMQPGAEYVESVIPRTVNQFGPGQTREQDFSSITFEAEFKITEDLYVNAAVNRQNVDQNVYIVQAQNRFVLDRNSTRGVESLNPHGYMDVNPYAGYAAISADWRNGINQADQDSGRITATYRLDFREADGWLSLLGEHQLAGMYSNTDLRQLVNQRYLAFLGAPWSSDFDSNDNKIWFINYFSLDQLSSDPESIHVAHWNTIPDSFNIDGVEYPVGWVNTHHNNSLQYQNPHRATRSEIDSFLLVMQSRFWDGKLVTTLGYRDDSLDFTRYGYYGSGYEPGVFNPDAVFVQEPDPLVGRYIDWNHINNFASVGGELYTAGAVFHLTDWLSLTANTATNIGIPDVQRTILPYGDIPPPSDGEGIDLGLRIELLNRRLVGTLTYFQTEELGITTGAGGGRINTINVAMRDVMTDHLGLYTEAEWDAEMAQKGLDISHTATTINSDSEGWELRLIGNLTNNWRMTFNASKVDRLTYGYGPEVIDFWGFTTETETLATVEITELGIGIDQDGEYRVQNIDAYLPGGFAREMLEYGMQAANAPENTMGFDFETTGGFNGNARSLTQTIYEQQANTFNYQIVNAQRRTGLRPYRANVTTAYDFDEGLLDGFTLGGGLSWHDKAVIGLDWDGNELYNDEFLSTHMLFGYNFRHGDNSFLSGRWRIQLNIRNVLDDDDPVHRGYSTVNLPPGNPISRGGVRGIYAVEGVEYPGGRGLVAGREDYQEGRNYRLTVTYTF